MSSCKHVYDVLASSFALYLKTLNYHWNVTGEHFASLHSMFEGQYTDLASAIDEIAERIRANGELVPASFKLFEKSSAIKAGNEKNNWKKMVKDLHDDQKALIKLIKKCLSHCQKLGDEGTFDLMVQRLKAHEKAAWMLGAHLN